MKTTPKSDSTARVIRVVERGTINTRSISGGDTGGKSGKSGGGGSQGGKGGKGGKK